MAKVTGIGGVFFKAKTDNKALREWWPDDRAEDEGLTVWHVAEKDTKWFSPSSSSFMINYRIDNMSEMVADLKRNGVEIWKGPESHENGKYAWILDPDGNKVELWEPMPWDEKNKTK